MTDMNVYMTDKIYVRIGPAQIPRYSISLVGCYIISSPYLNQWRRFANGLFIAFSEIWKFPF